MIDHITPQQRLNPQPESLETKRARARDYLRARGKLLLDPGCKWRPTPSVDTDVLRTMQSAIVAASVADCVATAAGLAELAALKRQAA